VCEWVLHCCSILPPGHRLPMAFVACVYCRTSLCCASSCSAQEYWGVGQPVRIRLVVTLQHIVDLFECQRCAPCNLLRAMVRQCCWRLATVAADAHVKVAMPHHSRRSIHPPLHNISGSSTCRQQLQVGRAPPRRWVHDQIWLCFSCRRVQCSTINSCVVDPRTIQLHQCQLRAHCMC
jgi:hypothetical protein